MHVCVTAYLCVCESQADTYDNTAASYSSEAGSNYIGTEWLPFLLLFPSNGNKRICPRAVSARCSLDSAAGVWERTDVTASQRRGCQTLTHQR